MDETEIKTRQGLILEGVLAAALTKAGYKFDQDVQYDESCEKPDFLIPNKKKPKLMVEAHQTEARNSFQMKTLRAFTAVTEAKAYFGNALVCVNVLFGNPDGELPRSNVKAMCGIFDVNVIPQRESSKAGLIKKMEAYALTLASDENKKTDVAGREVAKVHVAAVAELARLVKSKITGARARPELDDLWNLERKRAQALGKPPEAGDPTYYKRCMLWALFLNDDNFSELHKQQDPNLCSDAVKRQLLATKLATVSEEIDGDHFALKPEFSAFLKDPDCLRLRQLCKDVLDSIAAMRWFFEDIRDRGRLLQMAESFVAELEAGSFTTMLTRSLRGETIAGIEHTRAWVVDCLTRAANISQNKLSRRVFALGHNVGEFGDPISHAAPRTARFRGLAPEDVDSYAQDIVNAIIAISGTAGLSALSRDPATIAGRLFALRMDGASKLQKLDPLLVIVSGVCGLLGLQVEMQSVVTIASDLAGKRAVCRFEVFAISDAHQTKKVLLNAVAVHDGHGDDKSKEWGARRLATLYRMHEDKVKRSEWDEGIFVLDGEWKNKDVARLHRSGWNHVVRVVDLEQALRSVFNIKARKTNSLAKPKLPMLSTFEENPEPAAAGRKHTKIKRMGGRG